MKSTLVSAVFAAAALAGGAAHTGTVVSDNFDAEAGAGLNYASFVNWDVTSGSVDLLNNHDYGITCVSGKCVDLDGSTNASGTLTSKSAFVQRWRPRDVLVPAQRERRG